MFKNYLVSAVRYFRKRLINSLILFFCLTAGITSFIFISLFVVHERSYDRFHKKSNRIFRLQQNHYSKRELTNASASANYGIGQDMATDFPEIERYALVFKNISLLRKGDEVFKEDQSAYVSKDFFKIFSFKLLQGNDSLVLSRPYTIALSKTLARKIFKDEYPIGKTLNFKGRYDAEVTGVFEDMPENSHMNFHVLLPVETWKTFANPAVLQNPWRWDGFLTYILLREPTHRSIVEEKIPDLIERKTGAWYRETDQKIEISLQPLLDIHLNSNFNDELSHNGNQQIVFFLSVIAVLVLLIAWINYVSIATVRSLDRAKEVGIRKVLGGIRPQLIGQFLTEAFIVNFFSLLLALLIVYLAFPNFSNLFERNFSTDFFLNPLFLAFVSMLLLLSTLLTGMYPAFFLSAIQAAEILKGKFSSTNRGNVLRRLTVFIPFTATVILLIGLFSIYLQIEYLKTRELGFDPRNKLVVRDSEVYDSLYNHRVEVFKTKLLQIPGVENLTYLSHLPGQHIDFYNDVKRLGADKNDMNEYRFLRVDEHFVDALNLKLLAGNSFTSTSQVRKEIMLNERAARLLGFKSPEDALDQKACYNQDTVTIKAVIQDYHHEAPKAKIPPTYYEYFPNGGFYYLLPISNTSVQVVNDVKKLFEEIFPGQPFNYFFLDQQYDSQYHTDEKFQKIVFIFLFILLIITCSGLFSLSSYAAQSRTKEIGIRKVMGASVKEVVFIMLREYTYIILTAVIVGVPVAYFTIHNWLESFSMRIELRWWMFVLPVVIVLVIALMSVIVQTLRAAYANPANTLKHE